jgi:hypothetical protein
MAGLNLGRLPQTKTFTEKLSGPGVGAGAPNPFSYEHKIAMDDAAMTKLGASTPKVGDKLLLHAKVVADDAVASGQSGSKKHHLMIHKIESMGKAVGLGGGGSLEGAVDAGIKQGTAESSKGNE